jgi:hypothetical protein
MEKIIDINMIVNVAGPLVWTRSSGEQAVGSYPSSKSRAEGGTEGEKRRTWIEPTANPSFLLEKGSTSFECSEGS